MDFILFLVVSSVFAFYHHKRFRACWKHCVAVAVVSALCFSGVYRLTSYLMLSDTEILNGYVTSKDIVKRDCLYPGWYRSSDPFCTNENTREVFSHFEDYSCGTSDKPATCQRSVYVTEYSYDYPWEQKFYVRSTLTDFKISRVDRQGAKTPPRYAEVKVDDPVAVKSRYQNYLLADNQSLLNPQNVFVDETLLQMVPYYPSNIYDYYKLNRLVQIGVSLKKQDEWNQRISIANSKVGHRKQANIILVVTSVEDRDIRQAIYKKWNGGKKNDAIIVLSVQEDKIVWADAITFLNNKGNEFFAEEISQLRDSPLSIDVVDKIQQTVLNRFDRTAMKTVEYMKDNYSPPISTLLYTCLALIVLGTVVTLVQYKNHRRYYR